MRIPQEPCCALTLRAVRTLRIAIQLAAGGTRPAICVLLVSACSLITVGAILWSEPYLASGLAYRYETAVDPVPVATTRPAAVTVRGGRRGNPYLNLQDGRDLKTQYRAVMPQGAAASHELTLGQAEPVALATGDLNLDGFPDLVAGYVGPEGGAVAIYLGNPEAFGPRKQETIRTLANGQFPEPFLNNAAVLQVPAAADFVGVGDFDRDGKLDVITAGRGGNEFYLLAGDGRGGLMAPQALSLPGSVTALTSGEMNQPDGMSDVGVAIVGSRGAAVLVYAGPKGVNAVQPGVYPLPAPATELALGRLDDDEADDLAALAGDEVVILHGRKDAPEGGIEDGFEEVLGRVETIRLPLKVRAMAVGEFVWDRESRLELALMIDDGSVHIVARGTLDTRPFSAAEIQEQRLRSVALRKAVEHGSPLPARPNRASKWQVVERLTGASALKAGDRLRASVMRARISSMPADDLLMLDPAGRRVRLFYQPPMGPTTPTAAKASDGLPGAIPRAMVELEADSAPTAMLPMRLNMMAQASLVMMRHGRVTPTAIIAAPLAAFDVDRNDDNAGATACSGAANDCSLRGAIIASNANGVGADMITFSANAPVLTIAGSDNLAALGDLDINGSLTIMGNGSGTTIIDTTYTAGCGDCKVFGVNQSGTFTGIAVSFSGVTIQDGFNDHNATGTFQETGGGIDFFLTGLGNSYSMTNCVVTSNEARTETQSYGGGINVDSGAPNLMSNHGTVIFTGTTISNNASDSTGGGLNLFADVHDVTFNNCVISGNMATSNGAGLGANGGGINIRHTNGGAVAIHDTDITNNSGKGFGGGVALSFFQNFTLDANSTVTGNTVSTAPLIDVALGGGLYISGTGTRSLSAVTITGNHADTGTAPAGGGIFVDGPTVTLAGGVISNNTAVSGAAGRGGGLSVQTGSLTVTNVTFSGNSAGQRGGALDMTGPTAGSGVLNVSLSRLVGNSAPTGSGISQTTLAGGTSTATVENNWWGCDGFPSAAGCQTGAGTFDADPRIDLRLTAAPTAILPGGSTTLTADVTRNTNGANTNGGNAPIVLVGLNLTFDAGAKGSINAPLSVAIPVNGMVAKTFTANNNSAACGPAMPSVTLDNGTQATTVTIQCPDLTISKSGSPAVSCGSTITYTLTVNNGGDAAALNSMATDDLPDCLTSVMCSSSQGTCGISAGNVVTANLGTINASPASATVTITATVPSACGTSITNAAASTSTTSVESNTGNNTSGTVTTPISCADLQVTSKTDVPDPVTPLGNLTYTVNFINNGPGSASTATVTDATPTNTTFVSAMTGSPGWSVSSAPMVGGTGNVVFSKASVANGETAVFQVVVKVDSGVATGASITNTAIAASTTADPVPANNSAIASTTVRHPPTIAKGFSPTQIPAGGTSTVTLTLSNNNAINLTNVSFTDTLVNMTAAGGSVTGTCTGTTPGTLSAGATNLSFSGITILMTSSCTVIFDVTGVVAGDQTNSTSGATTAELAVSGPPSNTATLLVVAPPAIVKSFAASPIELGTNTTMSFQLTNPNATTTLNGVAFSDTLPAGITVVSATTPQCGGTVGTTSSSVTFSGGVLAGGATCPVNVTVTGAQAGSWQNTATNVTSTEGGAGVNSNTATLVVVAQPVISKAFGALNIAINGTTSLTFTIQNPAANTVALTGIAFTDTLPAGLVVATPSGLAGMCGGAVTAVAGSGSVSLTGGSLAVGGTCMIAVNVTGTTSGAKNNLSGNVTSTNGGTGNQAMATVNVAAPPTFTKNFVETEIPLGGTATLNFSITNPNSSLAMTGIGFTDTLPAGLTAPNATTPGTCGGTLAINSNVITFSGGSLTAGAPGNTCTFAVTVTGATAGLKTNTSGAISSTESGPGGTATDTITVVAPPTISKAFGAPTIPLNGTTSLTFTINNPSAVAQTGVAFSDTLPAGLVVATPDGLSGMCGGTVTAVAGSGSISLSGGTLTGSGSCVIVVNVTGATAGVKDNTTGTISSTNGGTGATSNTASVTVVSPPTITKAFGAPNIALNGTTSLTFTINNPNSAVGLTGIAFSDTLPTGLVVATPNGLSGVCGGAVTAVAGMGSISLSGGTLAAGGSCMIAVNVTGTTPGAKNNTTSTISSTNGGTGATSNTATLAVGTPPTISKAFGAATIPLNGTTSVSFTITNSNASQALTGVSFSDTLPAGLVVATPNGLSGMCGGTVTATDGSGSISLAGGTLAVSPGPGNSCTITLNVTGTTGGVKNNTTDPVSSNETGAGAPSNTATLTVVGPPVLVKAFTPPSIPLGLTTSLGFTINNPNTTAGLSGIDFTDTLPVNLTVADSTTPNVCGAGSTLTVTAATRTIALTGGNLTSGAPTNTCTFNVTVGATAPGGYTNTVNSVASTEGGTNSTPATANLTVVAPPIIGKAFGAASIALNATTSLTFTIQNPAANTVGLAAVSFTDTLPAGLVVATPNGLSGMCGGTVTAVAGSGSVSLTGGSLAIGGSCIIVVDVTGSTAGVKSNSVTVSSANGGVGNTAMASVTVGAPPTIVKAFGAATIPLSGSTSVSFTINNPNASLNITGVAFSDTLPAGLVVATPNGLSGMCGGTVTAVAGSSSISLAGGSIPPSGSCVITLNVTGTTAGVKNNTTDPLSSNETGTGAVSNTATVTVVAPPTVSKAFGAATIPLGGFTSLTLTINNPNTTVGLTGIAFSDTLPAGLVVATPNGLSGVCGGAVTAVAGSGSISLSGGTLAASGSCMISVNVTGAAAGLQNNTTGTISSTEGGTGATSNTASVTVVAPPTISKAFGAANVALNGSTSLTFTINNPNTTVGLNGIAFTDTLPGGLVVATPNGLSGVCGGAVTAVDGSGSISLSGGTLAASGSCTIAVNVTGTTGGVKNNTTSAITSANGGTGATSNTATVTVASPPTIVKAFGTAAIPLSGTTSVSFTINNPNASLNITGVAFSDTLPTGLVVATPNGLSGMCGGTVTAVAGSSSISLAGGSIPPSGSCVITLNVTGTTAGVKNNTTDPISSNETGTGAASNTATVTVVASATISKAFGAPTIPLGGFTSLTLTINNPNTTVGLTGIAFSDTLPAGLVVATPNGLSGVCGGAVTAVAGSGSISLSGGTLAASGSCMISVNITGAAAGLQNNTTGTISSTEGGTGATSNTASVTVLGPPTFSKAFGAANIALNGSTSLTFTINNTNTTVGLTGIAFNDTLPGGLVVATPNGLSGVCGGAVTAVAGSGSISLSGGTLGASGSCTIVVNVTGTTSGVKNNTTDAITSTNGGPGNTAMASISVASPPTIAKAFGATDIKLGGTTSLTFTITNPGTVALTGVAFSDTLPSGLLLATPNGLSNSCGGTVTATSGTSLISLTGGTVAASTSCTLAVNVTNTTPGPKDNTTGPVSSTESGPGTTSNTATVTAHPITISIADPAQCLGPGGVVGVTATVTNAALSPQAISFTATLDPGLVAIPGSCVTTVGTCTVVNGSTVTMTAVLAPGQTVTLTYQGQVGNVPAGTLLCIDSAATFAGGTPVTVQACTRINCPIIGPGDIFPSSSEISDQKAGSILVYNIYTSSASMPTLQNSVINMTNVHPSQSAFVHMFFVDGATCSIADAFMCLTSNQTISFLASDLDPGTTGYLLAVAVDQGGCPRNFNYLIGDLYVKFASGHAASLGAESISAVTGGLPPCDGNSQTAVLAFDNVSYNALPRVLAADNIPDRPSGNDTLLVLNRVGGNLMEGASPIGSIFGQLFNEAEQTHSFSFNTGRCQLVSTLSNSFPRTVPPFETVIPGGQVGWLKLWGTSDIGILGAIINTNPNAATNPGAFNQGRNLHKLRLTTAATITIPIFPPGC